MEINRQYIGARYVPKFYEGTNGTEWEENVIYEPLTIVTYLNNSYTSKKSVPAAIGNPMANAEYWAATGNYNAQIEAYRAEVAELNENVEEYREEVEDLTARDKIDNVIFLGDSYGDLTPSSWWESVISYLGITNHFESCIGGTGFATTFGGNSFLQNLTALGSSITDKDSIQHIVIIGGINDCVGSFNPAIKTAMHTFNTYVKTNYKNAKVHLGFVGVQSVNSTDQYQRTGEVIRKVIKTYIEGAAECGWHYLTNSEYIMKNYRLLNLDGLHPVLDGTYEIGRQVTLGLVSGACDVHYEFDCAGMTDTPSTGVSKVTSNRLIDKIKIDNDVTTVMINNNAFSCGTSFPQSTSILNALELTEIDGVCPILTCDENFGASFVVPSLLTMVDGADTYFVYCASEFQIKDGKLSVLTAPNINKEGTTFGNAKVSTVDYAYGRFTMNTNML